MFISQQEVSKDCSSISTSLVHSRISAGGRLQPQYARHLGLLQVASGELSVGPRVCVIHYHSIDLNKRLKFVLESIYLG